eukprot:scaffold1883_cov396-Prasinococcus_capsulatus_cf.AAC.10
MNKVLSRHLHKKDDTVNPDELWKGLDEVEEVDEEEEKARMKLKLQETRKLNKEKKLKKKKKQKRTRRPGTGGLSVVKFLWAHIKANKLQQNPNDGREITCDEKMQEIFGQPTVTMLQMNKVRASKNMQKASAWWALLTSHLTKKVPTEYAQPKHVVEDEDAGEEAGEEAEDDAEEGEDEDDEEDD